MGHWKGTKHWDPGRMAANWTTCVLFLFCIVTIEGAYQLHYNLTEEGRANDYIGNIPADAKLNDFISGETLDKLKYHFLDPDEKTALFDLDEDTGLLSTKIKVDREAVDGCSGKKVCNISINAIAQEEGKSSDEVFIIYINLIDINDNYPIFTPNHREETLMENMEPRLIFPIPTARDSDSPRNGVFNYELISDDKDKFKLVVDRFPDGGFDVELHSLKALDREIQDKYFMQVVAKDGGNPSKSGTLNITINIGDKNDNYPVFDQTEYEFHLMENVTVGSVIGNIHATDKDTGKNQIIKYGFAPRTAQDYGDTFAIDSDSGDISVKRSLDFERKFEYKLTATAQDYGENSIPVNVPITLKITDINDHAPKITVNVPKDGTPVEFLEHSNPAGDVKLVAHLAVSDDDAGMNEKFNCTLNHAKFYIFQTSGTQFLIQTKENFDRETQSSYNLHFICEDWGVPKQMSQEIIVVNILDKNDQKPQFTQSQYTTEIPEDTQVGASVFTVKAVDSDIDGNSALTYTLEEDGGGAFAIDPLSGVIRTVKTFDREMVEHFELTVKATDGGDSPKTGLTNVWIAITDVDDSPPKFKLTKFVLHVKEGERAGTEVGKLEAVDRDKPPNNGMTYSMSESDHFIINSNTGVITTTRELDHEQVKVHSYTAYVESKDGKHPKDSARVLIYVDDINDNAPTILFPTRQNKTAYMSRRTPVGSIVTRVQAYDKDSNEKLTYSITEGNEEGIFVIVPSNGSILLNRDLSSVVNTVYRLVLMVKDEGEKMGIGILNINVSDSVPYTPNPSSSMGGATATPVPIGLVAGVTTALLILVIVLILCIACVLVRRRGRKNNVVNKNNNGKVPMNITISNCDISKPENVRGIDNRSYDIPKAPAKMSNMSSFIQTKDSRQQRHAISTVPLPQKTPSEGEGSSISVSMLDGYDNGVECHFSERDSDSGVCADVSPGSHSQSLEEEDTKSYSSQAKSDGSTPSILKLKGLQSSNPSRAPPNRQPSFSEWLMSEGKYLNKKGHTYKVSGSESPQPGNQKTVRFSEPLFDVHKSSSEDDRTPSISPMSMGMVVPPPPMSSELPSPPSRGTDISYQNPAFQNDLAEYNSMPPPPPMLEPMEYGHVSPVPMGHRSPVANGHAPPVAYHDGSIAILDHSHAYSTIARRERERSSVDNFPEGSAV